MIQPLFDFPVYFKFFIGLFALVNPVGIIPVFISMTSYQTATARNKTNLTANLSVAIILWSSLSVNGGARGDQLHYRLGDALSQHRAFAWLFSCHCAFCALLLGRVPYGAVAGSFAGANWYQRYYPNHGVVVNGARHRIYCHRNKRHFPRLAQLNSHLLIYRRRPKGPPCDIPT